MNPLSAVPLYLQLQNRLRSKIDSGEWKAGTKIPSEAELSGKYNISRITVRMALSALVNEGLLEKKQGKGSFVTSNKPMWTMTYNNATSFSEFCSQNNMVPKRVQLFKKVEKANDFDIAILGASGNENIIYLAHVLIANDTIIELAEHRLRESFSFLMDENLEKYSLLQLVQDKTGGKIKSASKTFEIATAKKWEAAHLQIPIGSPLLMLRELWTNRKNKPLCRTKELFIDKIRFAENSCNISL
jgi:GntR family transcriptional regulator